VISNTTKDYCDNNVQQLGKGVYLYAVIFLADRTNGRAIATLLRLSSSSSSDVCLWRYVLWL